MTAVTLLNAPNLAIGGIVGSNLFNLVLIAMMDLAYQPGSILAPAQEGHILSGGLGILLMGLAAISPLVGPLLNGSGFLGISFIGFAIIVIYVFGARLVGGSLKPASLIACATYLTLSRYLVGPYASWL